MPLLATFNGVFYCRKMGRALLLPIQRKTYIRQLGTAAALSHFQLWAGMALVLTLWRLLIGPQPLPWSVLAGVLAFSAAFQVAAFSVVVWTARYRLRAVGWFSVMLLLAAVLSVVEIRWIRSLLVTLPGKLPSDAFWMAGILALLGLLITWDAYRRWLVTDFD